MRQVVWDTMVCDEMVSRVMIFPVSRMWLLAWSLSIVDADVETSCKDVQV